MEMKNEKKRLKDLQEQMKSDKAKAKEVSK